MVAQPARRGLRGAVERGQKTSIIVAKRIVRDIVEQGLVAGDRLPPEADMIAEYEVGRASVREALRLLEANGLVVVKPGQGGGPVVSQVTASDFAAMSTLFYEMIDATFGEVVEARVVLEPAMAGLVARRADPEQLRRLEDCIARTRAALPEDTDNYIAVAQEFHREISGASGNRVLDLFAESCSVLYEQRVLAAYDTMDARKMILREHERIARAMIAGDAARAEKLMRAHVEGMVDHVRERHPATYDEVLRWT